MDAAVPEEDDEWEESPKISWEGALELKEEENDMGATLDLPDFKAPEEPLPERELEEDKEIVEEGIVELRLGVGKKCILGCREGDSKDPLLDLILAELGEEEEGELEENEVGELKELPTEIAGEGELEGEENEKDVEVAVLEAIVVDELAMLELKDDEIVEEGTVEWGESGVAKSIIDLGKVDAWGSEAFLPVVFLLFPLLFFPLLFPEVNTFLFFFFFLIFKEEGELAANDAGELTELPNEIVWEGELEGEENEVEEMLEELGVVAKECTDPKDPLVDSRLPEVKDEGAGELEDNEVAVLEAIVVDVLLSMLELKDEIGVEVAVERGLGVVNSIEKIG